MLAAGNCVRLAAQIGARLTAIHVVPPIHLFTYEFDVTEQVHESYRRLRDKRTKEVLEPVAELAALAKVPCKTILVDADEPYEAILKAAHDEMCDLVAMASHGRRGIAALLIGSTTQKVLTHSALPVMVFR